MNHARKGKILKQAGRGQVMSNEEARREAIKAIKWWLDLLKLQATSISAALRPEEMKPGEAVTSTTKLSTAYMRLIEFQMQFADAMSGEEESFFTDIEKIYEELSKDEQNQRMLTKAKDS